MDSNRSAKRRKLDNHLTNPVRSPSTSGRSATRITYSNKNVNSTRKRDSGSTSQPSTNGVKEHSLARGAWLEAKAKSQAQRGKKIRLSTQNGGDVDASDDTEGAHSQQVLEKKETTVILTPKKNQLDPLRNQRSGSTTTSTPAKGGTPLGFFKQFHHPKPAIACSDPKSIEKADELVDGVANHARESPEGNASAGAAEEDEGASEDVQEPAQSSPLQGGGQASSKRWAYAEKPKKTFEDEIRELESAARKEAEKDDDEALATQPAGRRSHRAGTSKRQSSLLESSGKKQYKTHSVNERREKERTTKATGVDSRTDEDNQDVQSSDDMEIDNTNDNESTPLHGEHRRVQTSQTISSTGLKPQQPTRSTKPSDEAVLSTHFLQTIQTVVLEKLTSKRRIYLTNLDVEYAKVLNLVTQTVTAGESNSMLLIGSRGSGKSALVNEVIHEQMLQHADDFHVVRLNGFIHTDDKVALREIWRQLGRNMEFDDDEGTSKNYADTLTTLLALLSHPAEHGHEQADQVTKSVIFIIDEFELFANHPRQTLLYNLFDIAQSRKAPIAVLGLTTRIDVAESLEKRVKSRFSHRYLYLSIPKSFATFQEACRAALTIQSNELTDKEREEFGASNELAQRLEKASHGQAASAISTWNALVDDLFAHVTFTNHLRRIYYTTKSVSEFHASMLVPMSTMLVDSDLKAGDLIDHIASSVGGSTSLPPDSKLNILSSLSTLQLALLICAARLTAIHNTEIVPFAQAYEEYKVLASKAKLQASASGALAQGAGSRVWSKAVAKDAWAELIECGLVMDEGNRGGRLDVGLEEIGMSGVELGSWARWCREI